MIYSLNKYIGSIAIQVNHNDKPVSYDYGNVDDLHKWIKVKNDEQIKEVLGIEGSRKYPLIWLVNGWKGTDKRAYTYFDEVEFYIAINSNVENLNKDRIGNFEVLYKVANDFIKSIRENATIRGDVSFFEESNFSVQNRKEKKESFTIDIWDVLIFKLSLTVSNEKKC